MVTVFCTRRQKRDIYSLLHTQNTSKMGWLTLSLAVHFPLVGRVRDLHPLECAHAGRTKKTSPGAVAPRDAQTKTAASYSPALHCSTIGAGGLNFSVRNGKRWDPAAIATFMADD